MANAQEIKTHIRSIQDTQKITNAMYLIASMKMRKAKKELDQTRPFFEAVSTEIKRIFRTAENVRSHYFYPEEGDLKKKDSYALLVISADKGMAGAYNQNVLKMAEEELKKHPDTRLFVVGEYGRQYFKRRQIPVEQNFLYTAQNPNMDRAREICSALLSPYDKGEVSKIYILYTDYKSGMLMEPVKQRLLPFHRSTFRTDTVEKTIKQPFEFVPSAQAVLDSLVPSYISSFIYSALVDSFCSEQDARMSAMQTANDNAVEMINNLNMQYNQIRQAAITQEITEVSAGTIGKRKR